MFDIEKWQEIWTSMQQHKLRTFLTAFGVAWSIFLLVILLGSGNGLKNGVNHTFKGVGENSIWVYQGKTSQTWEGQRIGRKVEFNNQDYARLSEIEGVEYKSGRYFLPAGTAVKYGDKNLSLQVYCVHPEHQLIKSTSLLAGRYINQLDLNNYRKVACIGILASYDLFGKGVNPVGEFIEIGGNPFKVIGVFKDPNSQKEMRKILLPVSTAQLIYEGDQSLDQILLTVKHKSPEKVDQLVGAVREQLAREHHFDAKDKKAVYIKNNFERFSQFQDLFGSIRIFIWVIGIGSLLAGIIGVSNIMLITVKDRTREIGVRKALGATSGSLISMILTESVFLTALAGYAGLLVGVGLLSITNWVMTTYGLRPDFFQHPEVNPGTVFLAVGVLIVAGAVAGLIPAMHAVRINPIKAIRQQ